MNNESPHIKECLLEHWRPSVIDRHIDRVDTTRSEVAKRSGRYGHSGRVMLLSNGCHRIFLGELTGYSGTVASGA